MEAANNKIITQYTNEAIAKIDYDELEKIRKTIEKLDKYRHIEIAKIFKKNNIKLSENNNGIFVNLNNTPTIVIDEIKKYISFINTQETHISIDESKKNNIENNFFTPLNI
tara:strand:+ start:8365 stop:8697 length:333 start_codon:yes stop_codon:yes gene_type:complete